MVAAYNEAGCIEQKLRNSLALDYPADRFEVLIGSDGSTDGTDDARARVPGPAGAAVGGGARGEDDGAQPLHPRGQGRHRGALGREHDDRAGGASRRWCATSRIREVGAVCGKLQLYNPTQKDYEESAYWSYESLIKFYEGKRGAVVGANGGLYAIRRHALHRAAAVDHRGRLRHPAADPRAGLQGRLRAGGGGLEETTEDYGKEFGRRARIAAGNFQSLRLVPGLLCPPRASRRSPSGRTRCCAGARRR